MLCHAMLRDKHDTNSIDNNTEELRLLLLVPRRKVSRKVTVSLVSALVSGAPAIERNTVVSKMLMPKIFKKTLGRNRAVLQTRLKPD